MNIAIVGVGLIGGSMALELKSKKFCDKTIGVDINKGHQEIALRNDLVDEICSLENAISLSDIIILSTPVNVSNKIIINGKSFSLNILENVNY